VAEAERQSRVLVVEDDAELRALLCEFLGAAGYHTAVAGDGSAALGLIQSEPFDAVVSDIRMPGMGGIELVRTIRERGLETPVILMTGRPQIETAIQAIEYGAFKYLLKPVRQADLRAAVDSAVRLGRLVRLKRQAFEHLGGNEGQAVSDRVGLEASFGRALASLWMAYQPIVRSAGSGLFGREALVRTGEPSLPDPGAIFAAAERLGRVQELGHAIRKRVAETPVPPGESVFVNLHTQELLDEALYSSSSPLGRIAPDVILEITERSALDTLPDLGGRVHALRELGFRIAVDDFGAGYAGLNSFAALEPDLVKLDMSLVREVHESPIKQRLIASMAGVCKESGTLVVAEGVEVEAERQALIDLGCDLLQGYLIGRPAEPSWAAGGSRGAVDNRAPRPA